MQLFIKNMVCNRCILVVKQELQKLNIENCKVTLGEVELKAALTETKLTELSENLEALGFEVLDNAKQQLIEKIKNIVVNEVHHNTDNRQHNFSEILAGALYKDYSYLSKLFSDVEGITIEKFIINHKVEKIKELLIYGQQSLSEIADLLDYSSVAHLSNQFKKVTGLTPGHFKKLGEKRKPLDKI